MKSEEERFSELEHPLFEVVTTTAGVLSIRNKRVNEIMHNPVGPWREANELYIDQSNLQEYLGRDEDQELVIYDVGLGAAANALAVLHSVIQSKRPIRLVSFEIELELLKFALQHSSKFLHFKGYEEVIQALLTDGHWQNENIKWELHHGDFLECIGAVNYQADIIYYDPYSPQMNQEMWTTQCFKKLRKKCKDRAMLYNYSQATPIRVALLEAGFFVGYGIPIGEKKTTTQAACCLEDLEKPLDQRWLQRWKRSDTPLPFQCDDPKRLIEVLIGHEQFGRGTFVRC